MKSTTISPAGLPEIDYPEKVRKAGDAIAALIQDPNKFLSSCVLALDAVHSKCDNKDDNPWGTMFWIIDNIALLWVENGKQELYKALHGFVEDRVIGLRSLCSHMGTIAICFLDYTEDRETDLDGFKSILFVYQQLTLLSTPEKQPS